MEENRAPEFGEEKPEEELPEILANSELSVQLPFKKVADTNEIISGWQSEWNEGFEDHQKNIEDWRFRTKAFLPENQMALVFGLIDEIYDGKPVVVSHRLFRYRVLIYDLDSMEVTKRYAFQGQDMEVKTVISTQKGLSAVIRNVNGEFSVLPMIPTNDEGQFTLYSHVNDVIELQNGFLAVAYYHNDLDESHVPVGIYNPEGTIVNGLKESDDMECTAITVDNEGFVWAHLMPSGKTVLIGAEDKTYSSEYQGFDYFGFSTDNRLMAVSWQRGPCENRTYLMYRRGNRYENFGKMDFSNLPGEKKPTDCSCFGCPVFHGPRFAFNKDGVIYLFDLDRAADIWK